VRRLPARAIDVPEGAKAEAQHHGWRHLRDRAGRDVTAGFVVGGLVGLAIGASKGFVLGAVFLGGALSLFGATLALLPSAMIAMLRVARRVLQ
jgi:hypothetical protein